MCWKEKVALFGSLVSQSAKTKFFKTATVTTPHVQQPSPPSSLNCNELAKFAAIAESWRGSDGPFKPLHVMNPTRLAFIRSALCQHFKKDPYSAKPLEGLKIADVGCGGRILSEPLARMGATVTGVDAVEKNINIARLHAESDPATSTIEFCCTTAEKLVEEGRKFDAVMALEVIEHVAEPAEFCKSLSALTIPDGATIISTINRSMRAYATAIVAAEYILTVALFNEHTMFVHRVISLEHIMKSIPDASQSSQAAAPRDIEDSGWSLKPNTFLRHDFSTLNQMQSRKNMEFNPIDQDVNKIKVSDDVGDRQFDSNHGQRSYGYNYAVEDVLGNNSAVPGDGREANASSEEVVEYGQKNAANSNKLEISSDFVPDPQPIKPNNIHQNSSATASSSSVVGVYSSSTDPVHVPSPDSRSSGAIRREVRVVGARRQSSDHKGKQLFPPSSSHANNSIVGKDGTGTSSDSFQSAGTVQKTEHISQPAVTEPLFPGMSVSRPSLNNQHNSRPHQQVVGHQRVSHSQHYKEWKPKSSQKTNNGPGVIGTPKKTISPPAEKSKVMESDTTQLQDSLSQLKVYENQNVIIAHHIRIPETDRRRLTFGTIGVATEFDSLTHQPQFQLIGAAETASGECSNHRKPPWIRRHQDTLSTSRSHCINPPDRETHRSTSPTCNQQLLRSSSSPTQD
ncbi:unnamed protein product [Vicia faba]|uniref:Methyltransferase type 11 domain-containing protein n=1 Tax=Vicia faba TaxID=3906 RepID=A0AAV1AXX6_VICFA|nr:unnamed protein product [Vicia faba]